MKTLNELNRLSVAELKTNYAGVCACTNAAKRTYIICMDGISSKLNQTKHVHPNRVFTPMRHICSHKNPPWKYNSINNFRAKPLAGVRQWGKSPNNSTWAKGKFNFTFFFSYSPRTTSNPTTRGHGNFISHTAFNFC